MCYKQIEYVLTIISCQGIVMYFFFFTSITFLFIRSNFQMERKGNSTPFKVNWPFRTVTAPWLLSMIVIIYGYLGVLTANFTVPKMEPIVNTFDELASSSHFRVTLSSNQQFTDQFLMV